MPTLCYRLFKWKPYSLRRNYDRDGICLRCPHCGSSQFASRVVDTIDYTVAEEEYLCRPCNRRIGYWAYGYLDPCFRYWDRSWPALWARIQWRFRRLPEP